MPDIFPKHLSLLVSHKKLAIIICAQENFLIETALLGMFWLS